MIIDSTKLKKLREKRKFSQLELANHLDLSQATIWEWEKKDQNIKLEHLLKLAEVLETDISELTKDGTTININNQSNNKVSSNSMMGFEINIESYQLQKDLIDNLKKQVSYLENEVDRLKSK